MKKDDVGNLLVLDIKLCNKLNVSLVNIYGPNQDSPDFYNKIYDIIHEFDNEFIILCGDWNLVQNFSMDTYNYVAQNNKRSVNIVEKIKNDYNLVNPWRVYNPNSSAYTWHKVNPLKQARLDFFLISEELLSIVKDVKILPGYRTDHSYIELELQITKFEKGKGFWHFNNSLLKDTVYVNKVKEIILKTKEEYVPSPILRSYIPNIPNESLQIIIDDSLFLEVLLMNIRGVTISYSTWKNKQRNETKVTLENEIKVLQESFNTTHDEHINEQLNNLKTRLEEIRKYELEGLILRSGAKWIEDGEKPTKYFCNLEKRNYVNKTVSMLINDNGNEITEQQQILNEIRRFYQDLYRSKDHLLEDADLNEIFADFEIPKSTEEDKRRLDADIKKSKFSKF